MREVSRLNPDLQGVLDIKDYNERQSGQRSLDDDRLGSLIEILSRHRLGLKNTEPDILGRAYEYLLRKFAEGQGQSAGEFYTPKEGAGKILLINASNYFVKEKPKNALTEEGIRAVAEVCRNWQTREKLNRLITLEEAREADYNLSPSQFMEINERVKHRPIPEILADLERARVERERADGELELLLGKLGLRD